MKLLTCFILSLNALLCLGGDLYSKNERIRDRVLEKYDRMVLPDNHNANGTTTVKIGMDLLSIDVDEDKQMLGLNAHMIMIWYDDRLKYNYEDSGKLKFIHYGDSEIWKPDIHVYNNARFSDFDHYKNTHLLGYSDGKVVWVPPTRYEVSCNMDLKNWPFDEQTCYIILGSWTSHGWQIDLQLLWNNTQVYISSWRFATSNWKITEASQRRVEWLYEEENERYVFIQYILNLKRSSPTFSTIVTVPALVLPILLLLQFVLPVDHQKRITIGCVSAILVLLEIIFLKFSLPKLGSTIPLIVTYYTHSFVIVVLSIGVSAILGRLAHPQNPLVAYPPPQLVKRIMTGIPATILCLRTHADGVGLSGYKDDDGEVLNTGSTVPSYSHEWLFLAKAGDRIFTVLFLTIYVLSLISHVALIKSV